MTGDKLDLIHYTVCDAIAELRAVTARLEFVVDALEGAQPGAINVDEVEADLLRAETKLVKATNLVRMQHEDGAIDVGGQLALFEIGKEGVSAGETGPSY